MKRFIIGIVVFMSALFLLSCVTTDFTESEAKQQVHPLLMMESDNGYVLGSNVADIYFTVYLPGGKLKLDVAGGNLIIIQDSNVYQITLESFTEKEKAMKNSEVLKIFMNECLLAQNVKESDLIDFNHIAESNTGNLTILFWGNIINSKDIENKNVQFKYQLYAARTEDLYNIIGINHPVSDVPDLKEAEERIVKIISSVREYKTPVTEEIMKNYEKKIGKKFLKL